MAGREDALTAEALAKVDLCSEASSGLGTTIFQKFFGGSGGFPLQSAPVART
jgi:hypothetical protein